MATRGRPRSPGGPTSAAERKREFDRRMRNADGQTVGEPTRTPVTLYLSAQAREMMRRHRDEASLAGVPPLLDSKLVEAALLAYMTGRAKAASKPQAAAAVTEANSASPPAARDEDIRRLRQLRQKIRRLNTELDEFRTEEEGESLSAEQWTEVRETLLARHRTEAAVLLYALASRLNTAFGELTSDAARMQALNDEVVEYLMTLLDKLERPD